MPRTLVTSADCGCNATGKCSAQCEGKNLPTKQQQTCPQTYETRDLLLEVYAHVRLRRTRLGECSGARGQLAHLERGQRTTDAKLPLEHAPQGEEASTPLERTWPSPSPPSLGRSRPSRAPAACTRLSLVLLGETNLNLATPYHTRSAVDEGFRNANAARTLCSLCRLRRCLDFRRVLCESLL